MVLSREDENAFARKWKNTGILDAGSASELAFRMEVAHAVPDGNDLAYLADEASSRPALLEAMAELVPSGAFDCAISDLEYYMDYYLMRAAGRSPDPMEYGHVRLLRLFETGMIAGRADALADAVADRADELFAGRLGHVARFRARRAARGGDRS